MSAIALFALAFVPMIAEAVRSARNEQLLRAGGAVEPAGDVFAAMQLSYPACFASMIFETWLRQPEVTRATAAGAAVFVTAKALKYWAIASLGPRWTFRILVPPNAENVTHGPYRYLRHPNYVAVVGELAGMAMLAQAPIAGSISIVLFGTLMLVRVRVEERALGR